MPDPRLSRIRTLLFGALAVVWFSEMLFSGIQPLAELWSRFWYKIPPENPLLATALYLTHAVYAPAKGALGVLAVVGLRSGSPSTRTALYVSMALIPPLNIAFQFREQGFPLRSTAIATVLSLILWVTFVLFREPTEKPQQERTEPSAQLPLSRWEIFQYLWFAINSAVLTLLALLFLFGPRTALQVTFPCLAGLLDTHEGELASLIVSSMGTGTHLFALATASWIATAYCRSNRALRRAVTFASLAHAGLFAVFPLRRIVLELGGSCAASSVAVAFVPLFVGWLLYVIFEATRHPALATSRTR